MTLRAMRFYEAKGLLRPSREGTARFYDNENRRRLRIILRAKRVGFSLVEIRDLLGLASGGDAVEGRLGALRDHLVRQTAQLHERRVEIEAALVAIAEEIAALDGRAATA
ncbi:MAG: MerR family DNA-binding protein [Phyllobacteriaceae bacterium]|nr:MerR family DNA-binding protein [Phyllobacteriaceae bacterium]